MLNTLKLNPDIGSRLIDRRLTVQITKEGRNGRWYWIVLDRRNDLVYRAEGKSRNILKVLYLLTRPYGPYAYFIEFESKGATDGTTCVYFANPRGGISSRVINLNQLKYHQLYNLD